MHERQGQALLCVSVHRKGSGATHAGRRLIVGFGWGCASQQGRQSGCDAHLGVLAAAARTDILALCTRGTWVEQHAEQMLPAFRTARCLHALAPPTGASPPHCTPGRGSLGLACAVAVAGAVVLAVAVDAAGTAAALFCCLAGCA